MAYIGRSVDIGMFEKQVLTPNSSTTTFALNFAVGAANSLLVVYGGVIQEPNVAYSVSGGGQQIVFSEAPVTGTTLYIIYLGKQLTTPRTAGQETTKQTFTGDGTTTLFTLNDAPVVPAGIMVFVDGILQREGSGNNYVSSGSTINFSAAPDSGAEIDVYTLVKEKVSIDTVADGSITRAKLAQSAPYWNASGDVGVGVSPTAAKLEVLGGTGIAAYVTQSGTPTNNAVAIKTDNASTYAMMRLWANQTTGNSIFLRFSTDSNSQVGTISYDRTNTALTLNSTKLSLNSTNVGVGTATPDSLYGMTIQRSVGSSGNIVLQGDNVTVGMPNILFKNTANSATAYLGFNGDAITTKAIAFPSSQVASSDPNTLDDYEEGTWTPVLNLLGTVSYNNQSGKYVKIGRWVTITVFITASSNDTTQDGTAMRISGLPFTAANNSAHAACILTENMRGSISPTAPNTFHIYADAGNTTLQVIQNNYNGAISGRSYYTTNARSGYNGGTMYIQGTYTYEATA